MVSSCSKCLFFCSSRASKDPKPPDCPFALSPASTDCRIWSKPPGVRVSPSASSSSPTELQLTACSIRTCCRSSSTCWFVGRMASCSSIARACCSVAWIVALSPSTLAAHMLPDSSSSWRSPAISALSLAPISRCVYNSWRMDSSMFSAALSAPCWLESEGPAFCFSAADTICSFSRSSAISRSCARSSSAVASSSSCWRPTFSSSLCDCMANSWFWLAWCSFCMAARLPLASISICVSCISRSWACAARAASASAMACSRISATSCPLSSSVASSIRTFSSSLRIVPSWFFSTVDSVWYSCNEVDSLRFSNSSSATREAVSKPMASAGAGSGASYSFWYSSKNAFSPCFARRVSRSISSW
mmetsp:Transcript_11170/g.30489  ORF Transcript_11170/g.30489 Transcript_11170/m.30489 type:complete len:361 (-) Transcript_11170:266-1348(-)